MSYSNFRYLSVNSHSRSYYRRLSDVSGIRRNINRNPSKSILNNPSLNSLNSFNNLSQLIENRNLLSSITKVKNQNIKQLTAKDNVLDFSKGSYYRLQTKSGLSAILKSGPEGAVNMPYDELNLGKDFSLLPSDYKEIAKVGKLFTYLATDKTGYYVQKNYSKTEVKATLESTGIKPGWFEVKSGEKSNKFYMLKDGTLYPESQIESRRNDLNSKDWLKNGYTKNSKFIIDGKEYKLDENGRLNIPKGTACITENIKIVK